MAGLPPNFTELAHDQTDVGTRRLQEVDPAGVAALVTVIPELGNETIPVPLAPSAKRNRW